MEKEIYIVCSENEHEQIEGLLKDPLAEKGFKLITCSVSSDPDTWDKPVNAEYVALWLTPKAEDTAYRISARRLDSGKHTVNIFPEAMFISEDMKRSIGKNRSVYASLHPSGIVTDLCSVLPKEQTPVPAESTQPTQPTQQTSASASAPVAASNDEEVKKSIPWKTILWVVLGLLLFGILFG